MLIRLFETVDFELVDDTGEQGPFNEVHAESAAKVALVALRHGVKSSDIGIIAPYNAQVLQILQKIRLFSVKNGVDMDDIKVSIVHSFQGQGRRAVVVAFTDDNIVPGNLTAKWQRIKVPFLGAKEQLLIVVNQEHPNNKEYFSNQETEVFQNF